jgi:hypothetical protein
MAGAVAKQKLDEQKEALNAKAQKLLEQELDNSIKGTSGN